MIHFELSSVISIDTYFRIIFIIRPLLQLVNIKELGYPSSLFIYPNDVFSCMRSVVISVLDICL